jgi:hypothetical protein
LCPANKNTTYIKQNITMNSNEQVKMKIKGNDIITAHKEANVSDHGCEEEQEPLLCLHFPFALDEL